jgi:hypothetical protein
VIAAPRSVLPVATLMPSATTPPMVDMMPPAVGLTELAMTSLSPATTCGSAADSEERKNRFTPSTSSTAMYSGADRVPVAMQADVSTTNEKRTSADQTRIWRRDQRSMKTPANGPISEYGRYRAANAAAPAAGLGKLDALKKT